MIRNQARTLMAAWIVAGTIACGGGGGGTTNPPPTTQRLNSVELTPPTLSIAAGHTGLLTAVAKDQQGAVIDGAAGYTFSSSAATVAEVSATGSVLAVSAGTSTITASLTRDGVTRTATSTVTGPAYSPIAVRCLPHRTTRLCPIRS
ncbi:MAG: Ig-like domain-containing protein [Gemmatimonadaceae bacterium]